MAARKQLQLHGLNDTARAIWMESARLDAVLGGRRHMGSLRSGLKCYTSFVGSLIVQHRVTCNHRSRVAQDAACGAKRKYWPPSLNVLLAWSSLFRSHLTLSNYFGFVKSGCLIMGASVEVACSPRLRAVSIVFTLQVFDHPSLKKAKNAVKASGLFRQRVP